MANWARRSKITKRVSQPERRRRTQAKLLRAAIEILVERGYNSLTLDMVSRRAGVSRGAQTNYYPTKRDLLLATARQVNEEGMPRALPAKARTKTEILAAFIEETKRFFLNTHYTAMIELHVAGRHDLSLSRELEALQRKTRRAMDLIWLNLFESAGLSHKEAKSVVEMTDHFFRGVALLACIQTKSPSERDIEGWLDVLRAWLIRQSGKAT